MVLHNFSQQLGAFYRFADDAWGEEQTLYIDNGGGLVTRVTRPCTSGVILIVEEDHAKGSYCNSCR